MDNNSISGWEEDLSPAPESSSPIQEVTEVPQEAAPAIPDTAVPAEADAEHTVSEEVSAFLDAPQVNSSIDADEEAYGLHGMAHPSEANAPFDMSVLDDPELNADTADTPENGAELQENVLAIPEEAVQDLEAVPDAEETPGKNASHDRPPRKGRPKRTTGEGLFGIPNILTAMVWLALTVLIGTTIGRMVWVCASDVLAFGREDRNVTITVYESDTIDVITDKLYEAGLIRYPGLFRLYASFAVDEGEIHAGIWDLNTKYDYHALVRMMSPSSSREVVKVMIPEGYSCRQIFALLEENKVCTIKDIEAYAANGELDDYWFLEGVERGDRYCLEGFLFPDTYEFYTNESPKNVLTKMLNNFDSRFDEELRWQIDQLNATITEMMRSDGRSNEYIASHLFSVREVVIVASMIEKETSGAQESFSIASVIYNRLFRWGSTPAYLNIDATIIYALDGKTDLTSEDMRVDSPYNTYYNVGLTPGPISNPGLASLKAALDPADTDFYFYVLDRSTGTHHFSRTQEEHNAFIASMGG